ncbi:response regulator [Pseudomonas fulva]|uniref:response regulator n=1 Tax=Pseudomonas fulva TaxID=47880 RepID=UPI001F1BA179|nr:response regulator [Pseudomonas fulva]
MQVDNKGLSLDGLTVIVVEDDKTLRQLMTDIVTELGGLCIAFETADDALICLLESHGECSLIIADHGVPGAVKGSEFLDMVNEKWPTIPTILTSGYRLEVGHGRKHFEYLFKPWSLDELIETMTFTLSSAKECLEGPSHVDR